MSQISEEVFVTGADGFIGSSLVEGLVKKGYKVRAFILYNSFNSWGWLDNFGPEIKKNLNAIYGDVRDYNRVLEAMKGCDYVIHLASLIAIPYSYHAPESYVDTNVKGTLNIMQAARNLGIKRVVHTSTSEVYGTAKFVPISEEHPLSGQSPYSASKIGADQIAYSFYASFDLPLVIARPFNNYGPRQSLRAIIPDLITQITSKREQVRVGSVTPTRDFTFVEDTVSAYIAILQSDVGLGEVFNIGSNFEISIANVAKTILQILDSEAELITEDARIRPSNSEVNRLWADITKIEKIFGWKPKYGLEEGFRLGLIKTIEWYSNDKNLSQYKLNTITY
jgi:NAD dependent epimerase/dehydratase